MKTIHSHRFNYFNKRKFDLRMIFLLNVLCLAMINQAQSHYSTKFFWKENDVKRRLL